MFIRCLKSRPFSASVATLLMTLPNVGKFPLLRMGRLLLVPKVSFHRMLGMTGAVTTTPPEWPDAAAKLPRAEVEEEDA